MRSKDTLDCAVKCVKFFLRTLQHMEGAKSSKRRLSPCSFSNAILNFRLSTSRGRRCMRGSIDCFQSVRSLTTTTRWHQAMCNALRLVSTMSCNTWSKKWPIMKKKEKAEAASKNDELLAACAQMIIESMNRATPSDRNESSDVWNGLYASLNSSSSSGHKRLFEIPTMKRKKWLCCTQSADRKGRINRSVSRRIVWAWSVLECNRRHTILIARKSYNFSAITSTVVFLSCV